MTWRPKLIKKLWVKFSGMDVVCVCEPHVRECRDKYCHEYVVSFTKIYREDEEVLRNLNKNTQDVDRVVRKFQSEVAKSIRKMKKVKL